MSQLMKPLCFLILSMTSNSFADIIVLSSGERLEVSIIETTLDSVHVTHPILGELHIATEDIKSIETTTPLQAAGPTASKVETELPQISEKPSWNQTIKLGGGYQSGQTDNIDINTSYHADRTVNEHEVRFDVPGETNGSTQKVSGITLLIYNLNGQNFSLGSSVSLEILELNSKSINVKTKKK